MEGGIKSTAYDGKMRTLFPKTCKACGGEFLVPGHLVSKADYCSIKCSNARRSDTRAELVCATCSKPFRRAQSKLANSRSGIHFCSRKCKESAQRIGGIEAIQPDHYGEGDYAHYRALAFQSKDAQCEDCGFNAIPDVLEVHHLDCNRRNNMIENLKILCPTCHEVRHYNEGTGRFRRTRSTGN